MVFLDEKPLSLFYFNRFIIKKKINFNLGLPCHTLNALNKFTVQNEIKSNSQYFKMLWLFFHSFSIRTIFILTGLQKKLGILKKFEIREINKNKLNKKKKQLKKIDFETIFIYYVLYFLIETKNISCI